MSTSEEVRISGVVHSRLVHAGLFSGAAQAEGLLLGSVTEEETVNDASDRMVVKVYRVTEVLPTTSRSRFYDAAYKIGEPLPPNVIGWFKGRPNTYHRLSAREACVCDALREAVPHGLFALLTTKASMNPLGTVDVDFSFYRVPKGERPKAVKATIPNLQAGSYKEYRLHATLNGRPDMAVSPAAVDASQRLVAAQEGAVKDAFAALDAAMARGGGVSTRQMARRCDLQRLQRQVAAARKQLEEAQRSSETLDKQCLMLRERAQDMYAKSALRIGNTEERHRRELLEEERAGAAGFLLAEEDVHRRAVARGEAAAHAAAAQLHMFQKTELTSRSMTCNEEIGELKALWQAQRVARAAVEQSAPPPAAAKRSESPAAVKGFFDGLQASTDVARSSASASPTSPTRGPTDAAPAPADTPHPLTPQPLRKSDADLIEELFTTLSSPGPAAADPAPAPPAPGDPAWPAVATRPRSGPTAAPTAARPPDDPFAQLASDALAESVNAPRRTSSGAAGNASLAAAVIDDYVQDAPDRPEGAS